MVPGRFVLALTVGIVFAAATPGRSGSRWQHGDYNPSIKNNDSSIWGLPSFQSLVVFGDSYSDDSRLSYLISHDGETPPVGWVDPANYASADGGRSWPQYVKQYTGANIYNYAVGGAVCSNDITPRTLSITNTLFPDIDGYEVPAYLADRNYTLSNGTKFMIVDPDSTVYSFWIGTNDLGVDAFLTDSQVNGSTIEDYLDCVYDQVQRVYDNGARYFVLMNVVPLNLAPLYAVPSQGGVGANHYWEDKPSNITEISYRMMEQVVLVNAVYEYRTAFAAVINRRYPGAHFALMDVHGLITDIYNNPSQYLNGTAPLSVSGFDEHCNITGGSCVKSSSPDSFLWFDELHPSEQTDRVVARTFIDVVKGASSWATYWGG